jgi:hypothetical protein
VQQRERPADLCGDLARVPPTCVPPAQVVRITRSLEDEDAGCGVVEDRRRQARGEAALGRTQALEHGRLVARSGGVAVGGLLDDEPALALCGDDEHAIAARPVDDPQAAVDDRPAGHEVALQEIRQDVRDVEHFAASCPAAGSCVWT